MRSFFTQQFSPFTVAVLLALILQSFQVAVADLPTVDDFKGNVECHKLLQERKQMTAENGFKKYSATAASLPAVALIGDYTMRNSYEWLQVLRGGVESREVAFIPIPDEVTSCSAFKQTLLQHKEQAAFADVVLWNFGLRALHLRPERTSPFKSIDDYAETLQCMAAAVKSVFPQKRIFYKITNPICLENFTGDSQKQAHEWMYSPLLIFDEDYELQMTRTGADMVNHFEKELQQPEVAAGATAAAAVGGITVLNHEAAGSCVCSSDGLQVKPLLPEFWSKFIDGYLTTAGN